MMIATYSFKVFDLQRKWVHGVVVSKEKLAGANMEWKPNALAASGTKK